MPKIEDYNSNNVGNVARLKTEGMFRGKGHSRYIVSQGIKTGKVGTHLFFNEDQKRKAMVSTDNQDHLYDAVLRMRIK